MPVRNSFIKKSLVSLIALSFALPAGGCDLAENHLKIDRSTNSEVQDYRDGLAPRELEFADNANGSADGVPELQPYVADNTDNQKSMPLVSISVNQTIPLRDALFELAKQANYDVQLDPRIKGSVIFTARNKPFDVVIDQLCEIAGLRYKIDGDNLRIELDTPYSKNYKIDYIAFIRKNKGNIKTNVGVSGTGGGASGAETGSGFSVDSESESNFWGELDTNIKQILASNSQPGYLKTADDPQITLTAANPDMPPAPPIDESALSEGAAGVTPQAGTESNYVSAPMSLPSDGQTTTTAPATVDATAATPIAPPTAAPATAPIGAAPATVGGAPAVAPAQQATLRVESLPTNPGSTPTGTNDVAFTPAYSINKQAGIVSVYANERLHRQIASYLDELRRSTSSQVLIEAKILEVALNDEYLSGINWQTFAGGIKELTVDLNLPTPDLSPTTGTNIFSMSYTGDDAGVLVQQLSRFGTVHALASPRLMVINNQSAVLSVAKNTVYFELDVTKTTTGSPPTTDTTVDSEIKTVPEGVIINVLPSIDLDHNQVSMQVRPTVTRIDSFKNDPGVAFLNVAGVTSAIPEVNVQEIDSVVKLKSGQTMVMGGLLEDRTAAQQNGLPVLSEAPIFGGLFRSQSDKVSKTELVIFLKASIIKDGETSVTNTDRELYRGYAQDRRPTKM